MAEDPKQPNPLHQPDQKPPQFNPADEVTADQMRAILHAEWSGPLPPPYQLLQYERAHPGLAERIVTVFEKQIEHRHAVELKSMSADHEEARLGFDERRRGQ